MKPKHVKLGSAQPLAPVPATHIQKQEHKTLKGRCQIKNHYTDGYGGPVSDNWESTIRVLIFYTKITLKCINPIDLGK